MQLATLLGVVSFQGIQFRKSWILRTIFPWSTFAIGYLCVKTIDMVARLF